MSNTRKAPIGAAVRQERWASSTAFAKPILGNLVARRCEVLRDPIQRALVWFIQEVSMRDRAELHPSCASFPAWPWGERRTGERALARMAREICERNPGAVVGDPARAAVAISHLLEQLVLDPKCDPATVTCSHVDGFIPLLGKYKDAFEAAAIKSVARTSVAETVFEALDFAQAERGITLVTGHYRIGKTFAAQAWALSKAGSARFVSLPPFADHASLFSVVSH